MGSYDSKSSLVNMMYKKRNNSGKLNFFVGTDPKVLSKSTEVAEEHHPAAVAADDLGGFLGINGRFGREKSLGMVLKNSFPLRRPY